MEKRKKKKMSAVKRWISRHSESKNSPPTVTPTLAIPIPPAVVVNANKYNSRGRSHSLDVQALENSGVRILLQNVMNVKNNYYNYFYYLFICISIMIRNCK